MSSESQQSDVEGAVKPSQGTSSETEESDKKSESSDTTNTGAEKTSKSTKTSPSKGTGKTPKKAANDSEPDIKEMVGSPRPVRNESPKPGTSQESAQRQCSSDEAESQTPRRASRQQSSSSDDSITRGNVREKPTMVDLVAKHIESLFSLMAKKDSDS